LNEAIAAYQKAIHLTPDFAVAHLNLGAALCQKKLFDDGIAAYKEAIQLKPEYAKAHYNLGVALEGKGLIDEAIAAYKEAIRLKPDFAEAYCNLGAVLKKKGAFSEALAAYRRGHKLGSKRPDWHHPSGQWVRQAEQLVQVEKRLSAVLKGTAQPVDAGECLDFARLCQQYRQRYAAAARFYKEAFAANLKLADNLAVGLRYNAACAAALAGCGQGKDAGGLDEKERSRLRRQALDWLRADLVAWQGDLEKKPTKARRDIVQQMLHWLADRDFTGVRGEAALAKLPEAERAAWRRLWADVAQTLSKAREKPAMEEKTPKEP
jgi:tetratricopeptide (TPR) repeat protein